jgi:hypothetical protein
VVDPTLLGRAVVTGTDWTTETILNQLRKENIFLDPVFQRRDAWSQSRKGKFIESIVLGLPIPQLVLAESQDSKGTFIIIDGKQRLLTLQQFAGFNLDPDQKPLTLKGLLVRKDLNGKTYADFQADASLKRYLTAFENQTIRTVVVRGWQSEKVLYIIFYRLNTSSVPLSPQELRQALHPGPFLRFAATYSETSPGLQRILHLKRPDFRMRDVELLVRYFAFKNYISTYSGNLKDFLDRTCKDLNREWKKRKVEILEQAGEFERAVSATFKILGRESAFRKWDGERFEARFNRAIFDIMIYYFSEREARQKALKMRNGIKSRFKELCSGNETFLKSLETTTKSIEATSIRYRTWGRALRGLGLPVAVPRINSHLSKN